MGKECIELESSVQIREMASCDTNIQFTISCSYIIEKGVCYLVLCEAAFPKKLAFAYLEDLHSEFDEQHGKKVPTVSRPYSFIEFGEFPLIKTNL